MFACDNGACLPWEYHCDGRADCADASDERACRDRLPDPTPAPPHEHHHRSVTDYVMHALIMTNIAHDPICYRRPNHDNSACEDHEFQCNNTECIRKVSRDKMYQNC